MKVLLDTHALIWWAEDRDRLSRAAKQVIQDRETSVLISAASAWELAIKLRIGKFKSREFVNALPVEIYREGFAELPISIEHALKAGSLSGSHKDPFDRMLAAQAEIEDAALVSNDEIFDRFSVRRIW
jgi:PIN domain nuclease of toxin-antitoxin system